MVIEKGLTQFVAGRSHKSNSILDLVLSNVANISVTVAKQLFSDHFSIYFYLNSPEAPLYFRNVYSKPSFNALLFNSNLQPLFTVMSHDNSNNSSFSDAWYSLISDAFTNAIKLKRAVRLKSPLFYSSHTIHLINQRETTFKQLGSDPSFLLALKLRELNLSISESIELDKEVFINQFDLSSTRQRYKLLRSFGFNSSFPPVMFHGGESFFTESEKALGFNKFFASVFQDKSSHTVPDQLKEPCIKLMNLDFSLSDVLLLLESCDDSSAAGADELPSFLLHQCAKILCAPVFELFFWIVKTQYWPDLWKIAHVTPLHKSGPHNDISFTVPLASSLNFPCYLKDYCSILSTRR